MLTRTISLFLVCIMLTVFTGVLQATAATEEEEANKAIVQRWAELWNTGDLAIADEIFAADFVNHDPGFPDVTDLESYKGYVVLIHTGIGISDIHVTLHDMVAQGDKVAYRYTTSYTMPDGEEVTVIAINIDRFADGKIVEQRWSYDMLGSMEQRGVMPPTREDYT